MELPKQVTIVEVGPRDGLQNEKVDIGVDDRVRFIENLSDTGIPVIEFGSFVSPKWVPQMAESGSVYQKLVKRPGTAYVGLVPNMRGLSDAIDAGVEKIAIFASASESFSQANINCSIAESIERFLPVTELARERGIQVRGYVSCCLGCPYEGAIEPESVARVARELERVGCYEISLGDTIGVGTPLQVTRVLEQVADVTSIEKIAVHFHDTYGQSLANILAALQRGVRVVDSSVAGLGGCPYAPSAAGNVATEDVLYMLHGLGIETGVDLDRLARVGWNISDALGRSLGSKVSQALRTRSARHPQECI